jgi:hypothetical protein
MGLLEDAIREHLDLKRKHGAPEGELERQEVEALGPVRRELTPEQAEDAELDAAPPAAASPLEPVDAADPEPEPDQSADPEPSPPASVDQPTELFEVEDVRSGDTPPRGFPAPAEEQAAEDDDFDEPEPEPDGEVDVLEETPDFLEETPEHDRLWFEQRPPRDFDFD